MDNRDVARALYEIAELLELKGEDVFKVRAYRRAADSLATLLDEVGALARQGRLTAVPGIGKAIEAKIQELITTGEIELLEELRRAIPPGVVELTRVPGLGARTAELLYTRLGIDSLDRLELACRQGELRDLPGLGARKEAGILQSLE
ncbi:MAG TPA: helix-hairpin-helix domain-containing protein, partial [Symbiobacteriaceae bacterium]|nr:helix-hairpin-helix domain-containing protein [Symbiobacteriaceae bacterium]